MTAKEQLLAAARAGGAAAVRELQANGGPQETVTIRCDMSADLLQYRLTDQNYHSVKILSIGNGVAVLSAPTGYELAASLTQVFGFEVVPACAHGFTGDCMVCDPEPHEPARDPACDGFVER